VTHEQTSGVCVRGWSFDEPVTDHDSQSDEYDDGDGDGNDVMMVLLS